MEREEREEPRRTRRSPSGGKDRPDALAGWAGRWEVFPIGVFLFEPCARTRDSEVLGEAFIFK